MEDSEQLRGYFNLILISRALERVGDHATNIAEDAVYAAAAEDIRHQSFDGLRLRRSVAYARLIGNR